MAKIQFTAFMNDARGKVAGTVFSKNGYGSYTRRKVSPSNAQTARQMTVRASLAALSSAWRSLAQEQRDAWKAATPSFPRTNVFGSAVTLSGSALFVSLNQNLATLSVAPLDEPPTPVAVPAQDFDFTVSATSLTVILSAPIPSGYSAVMMATSAQSPGRSNLKNQYRQIATIASGALPTTAMADYTAKFGAPSPGSKIGLKLYLISNTTGQAGLATVKAQIVA